MFTIRCNNTYFSKDHSKVILFNTPDEANNFLNGFMGYAMQRAMQEGGLNAIGEVMSAQMNIQIEPVNDINIFKETINFTELKK